VSEWVSAIFFRENPSSVQERGLGLSLTLFLNVMMMMMMFRERAECEWVIKKNEKIRHGSRREVMVWEGEREKKSHHPYVDRPPITPLSLSLSLSLSWCVYDDVTQTHPLHHKLTLLRPRIQNPPTFQPPFNKVFVGVLAFGIPFGGVSIIANAVNFQNRKHGFDKNPQHN